MSPEESRSLMGRKLAVLRTALNKTQSCLARESKVKRPSISEYEAGLTTPDATTLERLLGALGFRWAALDLAGWFLARLFTECRLSDGTEEAPMDAPALEALARELGEMAAQLNRLAEGVRAGKGGDAPNMDLQAQDEPLPGDREEAGVHVAHLRTLARPEQSRRLQAIPRRVVWAVSELLCIESQRLAAEDPDRAAAASELAREAAGLASGGEAWRAKVRGLAEAHLGNALRARGDLGDAERVFRNAEESWKAGEGAYPGLLEEGLIFALKASLRRAERRLDEAARLLEEASTMASGDRFRTQVLISQARIADELGNTEEAVRILERARGASLPQVDGRIILCIEHNLADGMSKLDRFEEANALLPHVRDLSRKFGGEIDAVRLLWTEGRIAAGLGKLDEGIGALTRVRGEFASRNMSYDTALVSLELGTLYADAGRPDQVRTIARHMAPIFQAKDVHREALAALTLFRTAAERERATAALARDVLLYLRKARYRPELRFERQAEGSQ
jgi:transcriptional regulator with XRE-family HTH domain/tetratricopeptide (TPR) repeat protein